jgi:hypothetical protein|tara:strand:- start:10281 stop:10643 length:363 start_codon:yes stop_codon:yes gene_type:complete
MLRQKFIGETKHYEVDDWFVDKIRDLPSKVGFDVARQVDRIASDLPQVDFWEQQIALVCQSLKNPMYFVVEYIHSEDVAPVFLDLHQIDVDDYLDYYNENKAIKLNYDYRWADTIPENDS